MDSTDNSGYEALARILDTLAGDLGNKVNLVSLLRPDGQPAGAGETQLIKQLVSGSELPANLLDPAALLERLDLGKLSSPGGLPKLPGLLGNIFDASSKPGDIASHLRNLFDNKAPALLPSLGGFLRNQACIALSLITAIRNVTNPALPDKLTESIKKYFFAADGYDTVDENYIKPPMQISGQLTDVKDLKSLTSSKTAEQYIRDIVRINGETVGDLVYDLVRRYAAMMTAVAQGCKDAGRTADIDKTITTAKRWFMGFSSHAEAAVMGAVEEVLLGAASFQLNPLIAAAAGTAAGTAARKATQHVFLRELNV